MSKVSEYRQHARECRGLAKQSRSAEHREMFLNIAATWEPPNCKTGKNLRILTQMGPSL